MPDRPEPRDEAASIARRRMLTDHPPASVTSEPRYRQATMDPLLPPALAVQIGVDPEPDPVPLPIWNLDGIDWAEAPAPPRGHAHWPQTIGLLGLVEEHWRCACGAMRDPRRDRGWVLLDKPRVGPGPAPKRRTPLGWLLAVWGAIGAVLGLPYVLALVARDALRRGWTESPARFGLRWTISVIGAVLLALLALVAWALLFIPLLGEAGGLIGGLLAAFGTGLGMLWALGVRP